MPGHDQLAKDLVRTFFRNFLDLAAPEAAGRLRPEKASFLDTQSATDWPAGRRQEMDLLVRVPSRTPGQKPVLIHVEIERQARIPGIASSSSTSPTTRTSILCLPAGVTRCSAVSSKAWT